MSMEKHRPSNESRRSHEHHEKPYEIPELHESNKEHLEKNDDAHERIKHARHEVQRTATDAQEKSSQPSDATAPSGNYYGSEKKQNYQKTMRYVRHHLNGRERLFSRVVHARSVEALTDIAAKTIFRPTPLLLAGLISAAATITIYVLARMNGYGIPGSGWLFVSFGFGYIIGLAIDMLRLVLMRRRAKL